MPACLSIHKNCENNERKCLLYKINISQHSRQYFQKESCNAQKIFLGSCLFYQKACIFRQFWYTHNVLTLSFFIFPNLGNSLHWIMQCDCLIGEIVYSAFCSNWLSAVHIIFVCSADSQCVWFKPVGLNKEKELFFI